MRTGRSAAIIGAMLLAGMQGKAVAEDGDRYCFARAYGTEHLGQHAGQTVAELLLLMSPYEAGGTTIYDTQIRAMMRDRFGAFFANQGDCFDPDGDGRFDCGIACDGGPFGVDLNDDGTAVLRNEGRGIWLLGGCDEIEEGQEIVIPADVENRAFLLYPLPLEACPADLWAPYLD